MLRTRTVCQAAAGAVNVDVAFLPNTRGAEDVAVVVDVLRMTTTASVLFGRGLEELVVVADANEAFDVARRTGAALLGERRGVPLEGFRGGNSPLEHADADWAGSTAILCTTNGSRAVESSARARHVLLGAIVNAHAVAARAMALAKDAIVVVCAGTDGRLSLDDVLGAGCIVTEIQRLAPTVELTDAAVLARLVAFAPEGVAATLEASRHAATLIELGFARDVAFAGRRDALDVVAERVGDRPMRFRAVGG